MQTPEVATNKSQLRTYGNETITPVGTGAANVSYNGECHSARMKVVDGPRVALNCSCLVLIGPTSN